jgi:hypothetical protein
MTVRQVRQVVDPKVTRAKFDREIAAFRDLANDYRSRGWFLMEAEFPLVVVMLAAPQLSPPAIVAGVSFDYTNYDADPPSVRLVNPFTLEPYRSTQLPTVLKRSVEVPVPPGMPIPGAPPGVRARMMAEQPLMQWYGEDDTPFLCLAGVREYHAHPGHSGDSWDLHRSAGAGSLVRLLSVISQYGVEPLTSYQVSLTPEITGFAQRQPPP